MPEDEADGASPECAFCATPRAMMLVRITPKLGAMPELRTFLCSECGDVRTQEVSNS